VVTRGIPPIGWRPVDRRWISLGAIAAAIAAGIAGFSAGPSRLSAAQGGIPERLPGEALSERRTLVPIESYHVVLQALRRRYLGHLPSDIELTHAAIRGVLRTLDDPFTRFLNPTQFRALLDENQGTFVGIGVELDPNPTPQGYFRVYRTFENSPAAAAGLRAGDVIVRVDGRDVGRLPLSELNRRIRGPVDTRVVLTIRRPGEARPRDLTITRKPVEYPIVEWRMLAGQIGYIALAEFNETADAKVGRALEALQRDGMKALIFDLRGNRGGILEAAIDVASRFIPPGKTVLITVESGVRSEKVARGDRYLGPDLPLFVLIDADTASAAEIVAGAIKDHGVGTLIGETTFGKGLVQQVVPLSDRSGLVVTTARYLTPRGREVDRGPGYRGGIEPDVVVATPAEAGDEDPQLNRALTLAQERVGGRSPAPGPR